MSGILKTLLLVVLGVVLGAGTSLYLLWKASAKYVAQAVEVRKAAEAAKKPDKPWDFWTVELENLANDLKDERQKIKQREEQLGQREARLQLEQQELEKTRKQIETMRSSIDQRLIEVSEGEMANLKKLSQSYSALSPRAAVAIFKEMEETTLVKLLSIMKPEMVGQFLEEMSKQSATDQTLAKRAANLSERLRLIRTPKPTTGN